MLRKILSRPTQIGLNRVGSTRFMATLSDFKANKLNGTAVSLGDYVGKPTLVVNVASL